MDVIYMQDLNLAVSKVNSKLQMLGYNIEYYNSFGILYSNKDGKLLLCKITQKGNGYDAKVIDGYTRVAFSEHFIIATGDTGVFDDNLAAFYPNRESAVSCIYVKSTDKAFFSNNERIYVWGRFGNVYGEKHKQDALNKHKCNFYFDISDTVVVTNSRCAYAFNKEGNKTILMKGAINKLSFNVTKIAENRISISSSSESLSNIEYRLWVLDDNLNKID